MRVECCGQRFDRLVASVVGRSENGDHADRVLVAQRDRLVHPQVEPVALHRHETGFDVPVAAELLPAHLDVDPHHQVRCRSGCGLVTFSPAQLHRQATEHRGFARADRRCSDRRIRRSGRRRVPQVGHDLQTSAFDLCRLRILVAVDHVLVERLGHQPFGLRFHPRRHERGQVHPRRPVQHQLVVDQVVHLVRVGLGVRHPILRNVDESSPCVYRRERVFSRAGVRFHGFLEVARTSDLQRRKGCDRQTRGNAAREHRTYSLRAAAHLGAARLLGFCAATSPPDRT